MHIIVGLGNPGAEYESTRHNVGWMTVDAIRQAWGFPPFSDSKRYSGLLSEGSRGDMSLGMLLPSTYMNNSGRAASLYVKEKGSLDTLILVHDEVDLLFGTIKVSFGRGAGGHNGVQSVIDSCGSKEFTRIRIGVAQRSFFGRVKRPHGDELSAFVLKRFSAGEQKKLPEVMKKVEEALELILTKGVAFAMQECNT